MRHMYVVSVGKLRVFSPVGVGQPEREVGCWLEIDVDAEVEGEADVSDSIADTVDYAALAHAVSAAAKVPCHTLERLARLMSEALIAKFDAISAVDLNVRKTPPPTDLHAESLGIVYRYERA